MEQSLLPRSSWLRGLTGASLSCLCTPAIKQTNFMRFTFTTDLHICSFYQWQLASTPASFSFKTGKEHILIHQAFGKIC